MLTPVCFYSSYYIYFIAPEVYFGTRYTTKSDVYVRICVFLCNFTTEYWNPSLGNGL